MSQPMVVIGSADRVASCSASWRHLSSSRSRSTTRAPWRSSEEAISLPIPPAAPVTTQTVEASFSQSLLLIVVLSGTSCMAMLDGTAFVVVPPRRGMQAPVASPACASILGRGGGGSEWTKSTTTRTFPTKTAGMGDCRAEWARHSRIDVDRRVGLRMKKEFSSLA
ncbi:hypothetical protein D3C78_1244910 [compost metagenome]